MLITLKSNLLDGSEDNINDANQFTNYFPGGFILKKNSQIGLLNCTYNINEGYVIEGTPLQMKIIVPPDTREQIRTVAIGSYTGDELAAAIQSALQTLATMPASNSVWPISGFKCDFHRDKQEFSINLPWDPTDELQHTINVDEYARVVGGLKGGARQLPVQAVSADDQALFYKDTTDELTNTNSMTSINAADQVFNANAMGLKVPSLLTANPYFASYEFQATATVGIHALFALSHPNITDIKYANIQLALDGSGVGATSNVVAFENNTAGPPQKILFEPVVSAAPNDKFRILIPVQYTGQATDHNNAIYQKYTGNVWQTLTLAAGSARYIIKGSDSVVFRASIGTPSFQNQLRSEATNLLAQTGGITAHTAFALGSSYILGEAVSFALGTPAATVAATGFVTSISAVGAPLTIAMAQIGEGYSTGNVVITGAESGQTSCIRNITAVGAHASLAQSGGNYVKDDVISVSGGSQPSLRFKVMEVNAGGGITEISINTNGDDGYNNGDPMFLTNPNSGTASDKAQITLQNARSYYPSIKNLRMTGFVEHPLESPDIIHNPLGLQQNCSLDMDTLGPLINLTGVQNATINADNTTAVIDETGTATTPNSRVANNLLIHLDNFPISSLHKGGEGRCVAALPYGDSDKPSGLFQDRSYNLTYHSLENKSDENHNQIRVRLTDAEGGLIQGLLHPTVINLDLRPVTI